ncbi:hypothetical protein HETIRDRAFT_107484 [Heterobasidion irregulare TC 32-1]|uniref:Uncharacterized protein n=1 Tax=Heterobasidion irregulare (strain TC 32-1) TaxID=747525 RepID=W4JXN6_HETIT|nr:uncharacterized protein HETIRDRAFT_107484 [Heterobasidion irregulare TC 32-1]ETW77835.1 hypothetical protein HETIRDRAFT_107484 [Heterobasidion irregulare TC 32-1]
MEGAPGASDIIRLAPTSHPWIPPLAIRYITPSSSYIDLYIFHYLHKFPFQQITQQPHSSNMPLFGKKHDNKAADAVRDEHHAPGVGTGTGAGLSQSTDYANTGVAGANRGMGGGPMQGGYDNSTPMNQGQGYADPNVPGTGGGMGAAHQQHPAQQHVGRSQQFDNASSGAGTGGGLPPSNSLNQQPGQAHGNTSGRMTSKVEHAVGSLVGSNKLKERAAEKEMEANAYKAQSSELAEAERLEREAMLRRERAVAHGAHPDNRHLGGPGSSGVL